MKKGFEDIYPYLHLYCQYQGWLEIGPDEYSNSWVRVLDEGGIRLELDESSLNKSLSEAEKWAKEWMKKYFPKEVKKFLGQ
jgi:hypothetical protein